VKGRSTGKPAGGGSRMLAGILNGITTIGPEIRAGIDTPNCDREGDGA